MFLIIALMDYESFIIYFFVGQKIKVLEIPMNFFLLNWKIPPLNNIETHIFHPNLNYNNDFKQLNFHPSHAPPNFQFPMPCLREKILNSENVKFIVAFEMQLPVSCTR